jgi:O-antigen/teichoic acid export membrane protein
MIALREQVMALNAVDRPAEASGKPQRRRNNVFWTFVLAAFGLMGARLAGAAFGFLSQLLLARSFAAADVGIAFLAMSITTFVSLLVTGGYHTLALTYLARYRAFGRQALVTAFLAVARRDMTVIALLVVAGAVLAYFFAPVSPEIGKAILFGGLAAVPLAAIRLNNSAANAQRRFSLSYVPDFVGRSGLLLLFIAALVFLHLPREIDAVLVALVVITVAVAIGQALLLGRDNVWTRSRSRASRDLTRFFRHRAGAMLLVTIVAGASADLVVMLGGAFLPPAQVAVLGVAVRLAALVGFFSAASQPFILRDLATAMSRSATTEINTLLLRMNLAGLSIMAIALLVCALFGRWILGIYGPDYVAGYWPLLLFMAGQAFRTSGGMNGELLALGGHQVSSATLCLAAVVVLVVLAAALSPLWGILGLAVASLAAEAFWAVGLAWLTQKHVGRRGDIVGLLTQR